MEILALESAYQNNSNYYIIIYVHVKVLGTFIVAWTIDIMD